MMTLWHRYRRLSSVVALAVLAAMTVVACGGGSGPDNNSRSGDPATGENPGATDGNASANGTGGNSGSTDPTGTGTGSVPLWRIRSESGVESYILGYLQGGPTGQTALPASVLAKLDGAKHVVLETAYPEDEMSGSMTIGSVSSLPDQDTLEGLLPLPTWTALTRRLEQYEPGDLARLKPWAAARVLRFSLVNAMTTTESWLQDRVTARARQPESTQSLAALEPFLTIYAAFDNVPMHEWVAEIDALAAAGRGVKHQHNLLVQAWATGDLAALADERAARASRMPTRDELVIRNRTAAWLGQLPAHLEKGAFIAVNVYHLVGPDNLLDGLQTAGYTVEAVR